MELEETAYEWESLYFLPWKVLFLLHLFMLHLVKEVKLKTNCVKKTSFLDPDLRVCWL